MIWSCALVAVVLGAVGARVSARSEDGHASGIVEIRSYNLKAGTRDHFHQVADHEAIPMLRRFKIDVVAYGPSLHDANSYYLMRAFTSVEDRKQREEAFYGSEEWKTGPRDAILGDIESYTTVVFLVDSATLEGLRKTGPGPAAARAEERGGF
jgi:hypothetical protein